MKILFLSHAYPPTVGGIEIQNYDLANWLGKIAEVKVIANTRGKKFLPLWMPYALLKCLFFAPRYDVILLGSGVLANLGWILKIIYHKPVVSVVHGLDLTFNSWIYQTFWVGFFIKHLDKLISVGNETIRVAKEKGIAEEKLVFIPNGIDITKYASTFQKSALEKRLHMDLDDKKTILTSGRLAKRKGVAWFINNVMPRLDKSIIYIVAGDGADKENIQAAIQANKFEENVRLLGYVTDEVRDMLFHTCDIFVQPNFKVVGDMEGFGISVIEAGFCGMPVVASRLEGLQDAIQEDRNGFLVEPEDVDGYVEKINRLFLDDTFRKEFGKIAKQYVRDNYSWEIIAQKYLAELTQATFI